MTDSSRIWNRHGKQYLDLKLEKSAFIAFVEFSSDMVLDVSEAATLSKQKWQMKPSIFHLGEEVALDLAEAMAIDPAMWAQARGADLLAGRPPRRVLLGDLRYCRSCACRWATIPRCSSCLNWFCARSTWSRFGWAARIAAAPYRPTRWRWRATISTAAPAITTWQASVAGHRSVARLAIHPLSVSPPYGGW